MFGDVSVTEQWWPTRSAQSARRRPSISASSTCRRKALRQRQSGSARRRRRSRGARPSRNASRGRARLIALLPLWAMCDRWDIRRALDERAPATGAPTIFVYDGHPGGWDNRARLRALRGLGIRHGAPPLACPCERGCPSCVQSPKCGNLNEPLSKKGASSLLRALLASA